MAISIGVMAAACSEQDCDDQPSAAPAVLVVDANTHEPNCAATVTLEARGEQWLQRGVEEDDCQGIYREFPRQTGVFSVRVSAPGYADATGEMRVARDECSKLVIEPDGPRDGLPGWADVVTIGLTASGDK